MGKYIFSYIFDGRRQRIYEYSDTKYLSIGSVFGGPETETVCDKKVTDKLIRDNKYHKYVEEDLK